MSIFETVARLRRTGVFALLLCTGCANEGELGPGRWAGTIDTLATGRVIVRSPDQPLSPDPWGLEEILRLGSLAGEGPELFGSIDGLALGPLGEIYILDAQASEIRVFDPEGRFQRAMGGRGEGPGELENPSGLALDNEETLWLLNWGNGRYSGFDPETGLVVGERQRMVPFASFPWLGAFENGTRLLDVGLGSDRSEVLLRLDENFAPQDTLPLPSPPPGSRVSFLREGVMVASLAEPFAPQPGWAPRPSGGIVVGEGADYRLHRIGFDGDTTMTIELDRDPVPVSDTERDSAMAWFREMEESLDGVQADRRPRAHPIKPAHGALFIDDRDRIWVRAVRPTGAPPQWDVFDADGRFLAPVLVPVPPGFHRPVIRGGRLAMVTNELGFPQVVVFALNEAGGGLE